VPPQNGRSGGLTRIHARIHARIHWVATPDAGDLNIHDELEQIDIDNFIATLAEVAISIASREQQRGDNEGSRVREGL
jgi:hypothetical protein